MELPYLTDIAINQFIERALAEDLDGGDHTSLAILDSETKEKARLIVKGTGIIAGVELALKIFSFNNPPVVFNQLVNDGAKVSPGDIAFEVAGNARKLLSYERLVLNCMQRMSGIATQTHHLQSLIAHTKAKVTDTRKTTPNFRLIEKWAVAIGGGKNHRMGLYDKFLVKDNHIDYCRGLSIALERIISYREKAGLKLEIEVEARTLEEVSEAINFGEIETIMLDNMSVDLLRQAVQMIAGKFKIEASGNITRDTIVAVAECGVDYISVGALTHSYTSLDMSLKAF